MPVRRSPELEEHAREADLARARGDDAWFQQRIATGDVAAFGSAPGEALRGRDAIVKVGTLDEQRRAREAAGIELEFGDAEAQEYGDAGWIVRDARWLLADGSYVPVRSVSILVREDGGWKVAANFVSALVDDDLLKPGAPFAKRDF